MHKLTRFGILLRMRRGLFIFLFLVIGLPGQAEDVVEEDLFEEAGVSYPATETVVSLKPRPEPRDDIVPRTRWENLRGGRLWTYATLSALEGHGAPLLDEVPHDVENWCPAYPTQDRDGRAAFWVGLLSALAKHESHWRPHAVGGGGKWYGLVQILPATARGYGCRARSGAALKDGPANLSCAVRIMTTTVLRDNAVSRMSNGKLGGVAADWGPLVSRKKRDEMKLWTRSQSYCRPLDAVRPVSRPVALEEAFAGLEAQTKSTQGPVAELQKRRPLPRP